MPAKHGLRVGETEGLVKAHRYGHRRKQDQPDGIHIFCWVYSDTKHLKGWRPILGLRFARLKDAQRAADALTAAGLDTYERLRKADAGMVRQIATTCLQW